MCNRCVVPVERVCRGREWPLQGHEAVVAVRLGTCKKNARHERKSRAQKVRGARKKDEKHFSRGVKEGSEVQPQSVPMHMGDIVGCRRVSPDSRRACR